MATTPANPLTLRLLLLLLGAALVAESRHCLYLDNLDYCPLDNCGAELPHPPADNATQCCQLCDATPDCVAAVFAAAQCWMKSLNYTKLATPPSGYETVAVWPILP